MSKNSAMTIVEFIEARIAEEEAEARPMAGLEDDDARGWAIEYAQRVLAECSAKRAIVSMWEPSDLESADRGAYFYAEGLGDAVKALTVVYKDHPDYQQEWSV